MIVKETPHYCSLPYGEDLGGDGQTPQGHRAQGLLKVRRRIEAVVEAGGDFLE